MIAIGEIVPVGNEVVDRATLMTKRDDRTPSLPIDIALGYGKSIRLRRKVSVSAITQGKYINIISPVCFVT